MSLASDLGLSVPVIQAPMAGASGPAMAIAVSKAGGLGSLPCAMLGPDEVRQEMEFAQGKSGPLNLNFFCHTPLEPDPSQDAKWKEILAGYYDEFQKAKTTVEQGVRWMTLLQQANIVELFEPDTAHERVADSCREECISSLTVDIVDRQASRFQ